MESRNITLTICGEWLDFSPRDRKAVCKIDDLFKLTGNIPLVSYPLNKQYGKDNKKFGNH